MGKHTTNQKELYKVMLFLYLWAMLEFLYESDFWKKIEIFYVLESWEPIHVMYGNPSITKEKASNALACSKLQKWIFSSY